MALDYVLYLAPISSGLALAEPTPIAAFFYGPFCTLNVFLTADGKANDGERFSSIHRWFETPVSADPLLSGRRTSKAALFLTTRRLRAHCLILALCLWSVYLWNIATPSLWDRAGNLKGTDFLHFYTLGSLALAHRGADLYNLQVQAQLAAQRVPAAASIRYLPLYPPQVSLFFAPFAELPYSGALILWVALSSLLYGLCCYAVWRACPNLRNQKLTVLILALAFPAFWHLIAWGQTSALALAFFTLAFIFLRSQREFLAGLALGCIIFKPQLGFASAVVFMASRRWKIIFGALISASLQLAAAWLFYGSHPLRLWMTTLLNTPNLLPHLLDHAHPLARNLSCPLHHQRPRRLCLDRCLLAEPSSIVIALFRAAVRHSSAGSAPHCIRFSNPRTCVPAYLQLDRHPTRHVVNPDPEAPALSRLHLASRRPPRSLDALPTQRARSGSSALHGLATGPGIRPSHKRVIA
jgi:hypothetical protein